MAAGKAQKTRALLKHIEGGLFTVKRIHNYTQEEAMCPPSNTSPPTRDGRNIACERTTPGPPIETDFRRLDVKERKQSSRHPFMRPAVAALLLNPTSEK